MEIALLRRKPAGAAGTSSQGSEPALHTPVLEQELRECLAEMRHNQMLFDLETEPELIDQRVFEYQAIQCRYRYLQRRARAMGLRAIL
ncbi:DUF2508 domain-containing protein [Allofournierella sp.]|uniref:DUF2508 domain-containing protein n=1 Tax=Allofournierella sp. TaxID=1940256 RepID=UPI003AB8BAAE